jgi:hypothetical protein
MAGYQNNISKLVDKIEWRLGLIPLTKHLPKEFGKEAWANVIKEDTLLTYSRYCPRKFSFKVTEQTAPKKGGWYYIDEDYIGSESILGVGDIDWTKFGNRSIGLAQTFGYGTIDAGLAANYTIDDIMGMKNRADYASMFSNQIIPEFEAPNKIRLVAAGNYDVSIGEFNIILFLKHLDSLTSIPATAMEKFEQLAQADVANFLANNLKYWDGFETVFSTIDLKISTLESEASKRETVLDYLEQNYVSAGNKAIPLIMTV